MRVLQILHDRERGGVEKLAAMIEAGLSPHGVTFDTDYLYPGLGLSLAAKLTCVFDLALRLWRCDYDALIAYQSTASILVGIVGWCRGCRWRVVHQTCTPRETPRLLRILDLIVGTLGLYSANVVNSTATWSEFARYPARYRRSVVLIEHGLDVPDVARTPDLTRRHFALPAQRPIILNVGRLAGQKNQDVLIRALTCLPDVHLAIAGSGLELNSFRDLATTLGVDDRLHMLGPLSADDVADLYAAADLFVFPSTWETFGLAAVEAAMIGLPMVVADLPVLREVLRAGGAEPVTFVAPDDVEGWISAIAASLAQPPASSARKAFAQTMRRKYSRQRMIESYLSLFEARRRSERTDLHDLQPAAEKAQP